MSGDFNTNIFSNSNITIKEEPIGLDINIMNTSASVPIPTKRAMDTSNYQEFVLELDNSQSPLYQDIGIITSIPASDSLENSDIWGNRLIHTDDILKSEALIHMDDDDIFQVDKADLIQGPTLAELNANDETLLGDLNFDDLQLPEEIYMNLPPKLTTPMLNISNSNSHSNNNSPIMVASSCPQSGIMYYRDLDINSITNNSFDGYINKSSVAAFSPTSQTSSNSSLVQSSPLHMNSLQHKYSTLQDLLLKRDTYESPERSALGQSIPGTNMPCSPGVRIPRTHQSRLSTSAPTHLGLDQIWQRREPRKHLLSTGSLAEAGSTSSLSTGGVLSPDPQDFSHDEFESDEDSDAHYEDYSSDNGIDSDDDDEHNKQGGSKKERYFWQYNVQAKGPKGERLVMKCKMEDPHVLHEITDPVFSPDCSVKGIKHSGKARKGDGNDLTPNARKLFNIGKELDKLSHIINDMTPVSELPFNVRPKSRKEKNKLASRACRLKKKAQHEANKIKLNGLETEHKRLINGIAQIKQILAIKLNEPSQEKRDEFNSHIDKIAKSSSKIKVAGHTTEYVNKVLEKLNSGAAVGLDDL